MRHHTPSFVQHLERYLYALRFCDKKKVLDAGSKDGFGAHLLSYGAAALTLSDISQQSLDDAQRSYKFFCPTTFVQADFDVNLPNELYDVIVAFEVIEHVKDPEALMTRFVQHLKPGGILVFSVPHMMAHADHLTLFDFDSIRTLVKKYLDLEEFFFHEKHQFDNAPLYKGLRFYLGIARKSVV
jgi:2-polyprenyl-3-methyl-5-hydroxy-6-metoxy-1,4-benzoquinol methylase